MLGPRRSSRAAAHASKIKAKVESLKTAKVTKPKAKSTKTTKSAEKPKTTKVSKKNPNEELEIGDDIPELTLLNQDEVPLDLKELSEKNKIIIIFAYPKASTPGCTRQACGFRDNYNSIKDKALVLGLSADTPKAQNTFKTKQGFQYDLLSDPKKELITVLGAKKSPNGIKRSHWIFKDGKLVVKRIQISPEVSIREGKEEVLKLAK